MRLLKLSLSFLAVNSYSTVNRDDRLCETKSTIDDLIAQFESNGDINGYIIPSEDAHLSEYVATE